MFTHVLLIDFVQFYLDHVRNMGPSACEYSHQLFALLVL